MRLLSTLLLFTGAVLAESVYIVHWTTDEACYECNTRYAIGCAPQVKDCGVPRKTTDHYEVAKSKDDALKIANEVSQPEKKDGASVADWIVNGTALSWTGGSGEPARPHGKFVAIYEATPLAVDIKVEISTKPAPPITETHITVALK